MTVLRDATRDLHHGAEAHPFGRRMAHGAITRQEWADWCGGLLLIHMTLDPFLPRPLRRTAALRADLAVLPPANRSLAAEALCEALATREQQLGAAYILLGASLRGGAVIRKRMGERLPTEHLRFGRDAAAADTALTLLGRDETLIEGARACFAALTDIMNEIEGRHGL